MKDNLTLNQVLDEIREAETLLREFGIRYYNVWFKLKIHPQKWTQAQYKHHDKFWVIGIMGNKCLCFNYLEGGWGWSEFEKLGKITGEHYQQDEIQHSIYQLVFNLDYDINS